MADEFTVETGALRTDASTWLGWHDTLTDISKAVPTVGSDLDPLAFSVLPGADRVLAAYMTTSMALAAEVATGAEQFESIATTLTAVADLYDEVEDEIAQSFRSR